MGDNLLSANGAARNMANGENSVQRWKAIIMSAKEENDG